MSATVPPPPTSGRVAVVIALVDFLKAALWPTLALIAVLAVKGPVLNLLQEIPDLVPRANVITLGQLHVELDKAFPVQATADVRNALRGLSSSAATRLIRLALADEVCKPTKGEDVFQSWRVADQELEAKQLITLSPHPDGNNSERSDCYLARTTDLGNDTQKFLIDVIGATLNLGKT